MTKTTHNVPSMPVRTLTRRFVYDHAGRPLEMWHRIDALSEVRLVFNQYNQLGQLVDKKIHSTLALASDAKQSIDFKFG